MHVSSVAFVPLPLLQASRMLARRCAGPGRPHASAGGMQSGPLPSNREFPTLWKGTQ